MLQEGQRERKRGTKLAALKSHDSFVRLCDNQHTNNTQEFFWPKCVNEMNEKPDRAMSPERKGKGRKNALRAAVARNMVRRVRENAQELFRRY